MSIRIPMIAGLLAGCLLPVQVAAQTPPASSPAATSPEASAAAKKMSDADKNAWTKCKVMPHDAMMKDSTCARIVKTYPHADKWTKDGATKPSPETK